MTMFLSNTFLYAMLGAGSALFIVLVVVRARQAQVRHKRRKNETRAFLSGLRRLDDRSL